MTGIIKKKLKDYKFARWGVLALTSFAMITNYYFYDALAPLTDFLRINLGFSSGDYGFLMSVYSIPNVFLAMAIIGGVILDRLGIRLTGFSFIFLMAIGGAITAYGASDTFLDGGFGYAFMDSFLTNFSPALKMMCLGFFIFGLGAETSIIVLSKVVIKWFKGKELALALGLNLAVGRLGTALALMFSPRLVYPEWTNAIWFGVLLLWIGLLAFLVYMVIDYKIDRQEKIDIKDPEDEFKWSDITDIITNRSFIFITLLCVTFYSAVFPFIKFAPDLLMNKFSMPRQLAGDVSSYLMYGTILLTPLFGWICDYRGKSATLMYLGSALLIIAHLMFAVTYIEPRIPIILLGIAFSLVPAAMWPAVVKIVRESKIGTAYGVMYFAQNIGLWAFPLIIGILIDSSNPHYRTSIDANQFKTVQEQNMAFTGEYLDRKDNPYASKEANIIAVIYEDEIGGRIIWRENHKVTTCESGEFEINIGEGENFERIDFTKITDEVDFQAKVKLFKNDDKVNIYDGEFHYKKETLEFISETDVKIDEVLSQNNYGIITIYDPINEKLVWKEEIMFYIDNKSNFTIPLGLGTIRHAESIYFGMHTKEYEAEIIKPLNYTNPMLVFALLGVFGLVFAFLLKREDKTSGYGLELPNKTK